MNPFQMIINKFSGSSANSGTQYSNYNVSSKNKLGNTDNYFNMNIVSSVVPSPDNYNVLNDMETQFFVHFSEQLISAKLSPSSIKLTRLANGGFNVDYAGICYVGKINLYKPPTRYAVIKIGNKRATKVFDTAKDADGFVESNPGYEIQLRNKKQSIYMQYLKGQSTVKELTDISLNDCIDHIPDWIRYIKYCKRN